VIDVPSSAVGNFLIAFQPFATPCGDSRRLVLFTTNGDLIFTFTTSIPTTTPAALNDYTSPLAAIV
jgi:hypothetical protein